MYTRFLFELLIPHEAHAIIFIPAIILIPIAKIVAFVIGGFSIPALGLGTLWSTMNHTPLRRALSYTLLFLLILGITIFLFLKIENPHRPLF